MDEAAYICDHCSESIVVPIDASGGRDQEYVEDCPVCCSPNLLRVHIQADGEVSISSQPS